MLRQKGKKRQKLVDAVVADLEDTAWPEEDHLEDRHTERPERRVTKEAVPRRREAKSSPQQRVYVGNLPAASDGLIRQFFEETVGSCEVDVVRKDDRVFAFVTTSDVAKLDGVEFLGHRLRAGLAHDRSERSTKFRKNDLASYLDQQTRSRIDDEAKKRQQERAAYLASDDHRQKQEASRLATAQGHRGHGFTSDGRPRLHSAYKHFGV